MAKSKLALAQERDFAQAGDGVEVALGERYHILRDQRLPELDRPSALAYIARDTKSSTRSLFARICEPGLIPRIDLMVHLRHMTNIDVIRPIDWGSVDWSADGERRFAVVFDRHGTAPLFPGPDGKFKPMAHDEILRRVIGPAAATLGLMAQRGLTHRAIRPYNIYLAKAERTQMMLGDCVMGDHGSLHAAIFEPTEYAMVPVQGRGDGMAADDLYALGVTALALAIGRIPLVQWSDEQVIEAKLTQDSFTALVGEDRPPQAMREILRGLLADDPLQRWTVADVGQYLNGGGHRIAELPTRTRAARPLEFAGEQHASFRALARAFGKNWRAGAQAIRTKSVEIWLKRHATEAELDGAVLAKADSYAAASPESDAKLVMDVAAILDPSGPVRYKGLAAMPDGIGGLLAEAYRSDDKQLLPIIGDIIAKGVMIEFLEIATAGGRDADGLSKYYKRMQLLLRNGGPGYGIERCLYEFHPDVACLSPSLIDRCVYGIKDLLPVLERLVAEKKGVPQLVDRHIVAFVATRGGTGIQRDIAVIADARNNARRAKVAMATLLARIQMEHGPASLPALSKWIAEELAGVTAQLGSKATRQAVSRSLEAAAPLGNLATVAACLDDVKVCQRDDRGRMAATKEYADAGREIARLESRQSGREGQLLGWRIASMISGTIAITCVVSLLVF